ncbi:TlpA disulfide reductase family protein [Nocardioides sp. KR10-350]|uniref:TlpA family protein disulfide reductase n=1 Tax=Nocardioides cheoyonin TaxID=3156615 RepID=UPI0032B477C1
MIRHALALVAILLVVTGCSAKDVVKPSAPDIDVATSDMVAMKAKSDIAPCPAAQTKDGGLPGQTLRCLGGGRAVDLSTLKGPLVLNFFFANCAPCRKEMPALEAFYRDYGDKVPVLGVDSVDAYPGIALRLAIQRGVTYPLVADPAGDLQGSDLTVHGMPTFFFLRADGTIAKAQGGKTSEQQIVTMVEQNLGVDL